MAMEVPAQQYPSSFVSIGYTTHPCSTHANATLVSTAIVVRCHACGSCRVAKASHKTGCHCISNGTHFSAVKVIQLLPVAESVDADVRSNLRVPLHLDQISRASLILPSTFALPPPLELSLGCLPCRLRLCTCVLGSKQAGAQLASAVVAPVGKAG
eukprot:3451-Heterococcus_DN1.PRE.3